MNKEAMIKTIGDWLLDAELAIVRKAYVFIRALVH